MSVLTFTDRGIYCPAGDFHIDPWRPADRALITHAHSDHARWGMGRYLATPRTAAVMRHRLGEIEVSTIPYGETRRIDGARVSFHPAGHVPGSAQIRVEVGGEVWVVSGDYKTAEDGLSEPFEPVRCHAFVSECTFGLPVFNWTPLEALRAEINGWWAANAAAGRPSILGAYSLGKAQRLLTDLDPSIGPILTHSAVENVNEVLRAEGIALPDTIRLAPDMTAKDHPGAMILAPPSALGGAWPKGFRGASTAFASGWMALRGVRRRRAADRGFVVSDHADWEGLNAAIAATGAERIFVTHGYTSVFRRWLETRGYDAAVVETDYEGESLDAAAESGAEAGSGDGAGARGGTGDTAA
ncbi:ligase-associated DNA damage response exonuclease [Histidinibacterium lentulum]|uniref:Ligase-associated DNA damage response exonuclease n=1 Tax=Histidinibacterium lentulum TaxID=2480588 RepID=A0A3N2R788_9RHOB|nr:ligase-associated DNA damage response exonuclease [Histidinibacterium lentulum]ROU03339.1 ligase-associated DNA damage response exonuclease [Histidinibacterium lentulum]